MQMSNGATAKGNAMKFKTERATEDYRKAVEDRDAGRMTATEFRDRVAEIRMQDCIAWVASHPGKTIIHARPR